MSKKVFIIDNEIGICDALQSVLSIEGYQVFSALSGEEALKRLVEVAPDLVVVDVMMPGINGYEVCKKIRSMPQFRRLPILMLTVKGSDNDRIMGISSGASDYMTKPFNIWEFSARARNLIENYQIDVV